MSNMANAATRFNLQAAKQRRTMNPASVRRMVNNLASGKTLSVTLSGVRATREIAENGFIVLHRAQLRVLKTLEWQPVEGDEFTNVDTGEVFRCESAIGATNPIQAEIVCDVIRISP